MTANYKRPLCLSVTLAKAALEKEGLDVSIVRGVKFSFPCIRVFNLDQLDVLSEKFGTQDEKKK